MPTYAELEGNLIRLQPIQSGDAKAAFLLAHDDRVTRTLIWDGPTTQEVLTEAYERFSGQWHQGDTYHFAIEPLQNPVFSGSITVRSETPKSADIGYWLGFPYWGKGYMTDAIRLVTYFVFTHLSADGVHADVFAGNLASRRVLEKNEVRFEGVLAQHHVKQGESIDACRMVLGRKEWEKGLGGFRPAIENIV
ncbi:MAG: GNAT family N-acetyltransferase [SAR202 cluster bacterium]|nr:GNAT family N-acetyltransferase [SAR202 cluster bacterium]